MHPFILLTTILACSVGSALAFSTPLRAAKRPFSTRTSLQAFSLQEVGSAVDTFYQTQPYLSAFLTCSVKAGAADIVAQTTQNDEVESTEEDLMTVDMQRNFAFIFYGGLYQGMAQNFLYTDLFPRLFGHEPTWQSISMQVALDMTTHCPFVCLPVAYIVKSVFTSDEISMDNVKASLAKYVEDVTERGLLYKFWAIWIPAQAFNFAVVPEHYRIAFIAFVSFFWMMLLSAISNTESAPKEILRSEALKGEATAMSPTKVATPSRANV